MKPPRYDLYIEPPTPDRLSRLLHAALYRFDEHFYVSISQQLAPETRARLDALLTTIFPEEPSSAQESIEGAPDEEQKKHGASSNIAILPLVARTLGMGQKTETDEKTRPIR